MANGIINIILMVFVSLVSSIVTKTTMSSRPMHMTKDFGLAVVIVVRKVHETYDHARC